LEAHGRWISLEAYKQLISKDMPGPNGDKKKAERLRRFALPNKYIEPWSPGGALLWRNRVHKHLSDEEGTESHGVVEHEDDDADLQKAIRGISAFLAVVCEDRVYVVMDFSRLVRIFVNSREALWSESDMKPSSWVSCSLSNDWHHLVAIGMAKSNLGCF
jgi:hypothetical protein